jgi:XTP/dITP diphosphohydrolase
MRRLPHQLVLASNNAGKLVELRAMLAPIAVDVRSQQEFGVSSIEETGLSFIENAILKARHASAMCGLPALADDSGLEVDALRGAPGIYSARYAGPDADDAANNRKLLDAMRDVPDAERSARFHCVLALMRDARDPAPLICSATWEGSILREPRGNNGFGYDPLFLAPEQSCSSAELPSMLKNRISHRARAFAMLTAALAQPC